MWGWGGLAEHPADVRGFAFAGAVMRVAASGDFPCHMCGKEKLFDGCEDCMRAKQHINQQVAANPFNFFCLQQWLILLIAAWPYIQHNGDHADSAMVGPFSFGYGFP